MIQKEEKQHLHVMTQVLEKPQNVNTIIWGEEIT